MATQSWWERAVRLDDTRVYERRPFSFEGSGDGAYNPARLPESLPSSFAHHAQRIDDETAAVYAAGHILTRLFLVPIAVLLVLLLVLIVPYAIAAGPIIGLTLVLVRYTYYRVRDGASLLRSFFEPTLVMIAGYLVVLTIPHIEGLSGELESLYQSVAPSSLAAFTALLAVGFLFFVRYAPSISGFVWSWSFTHPRITDPQVRNITRRALADLQAKNPPTPYLEKFSPSYLRIRFYFLVYCISLVPLIPIVGLILIRIFDHPGPLFYVVLATPLILLGLVYPFFSFLDDAAVDFSEVFPVLGHYLTYDTTTSNAPGIWRAGSPLRRRQLLLVGYLVLISVAFFGPLLRGPVPYRADAPAATTPQTAPRTVGDVWLRAATAHGALILDAATTGAAPVTAKVALTILYFFPLLGVTVLLFLIAATYPANRARKWHAYRYFGSYPDTDGPIDYANRQRTYNLNEDSALSDWGCLVHNLQTSTCSYADPLDDHSISLISPPPIRESDHLFLGFETRENVPVLLHRDLLREHTYIMGDSGSGKTSLGILPLVLQLMHDNAPILVLDLKGDRGLCNAIRFEADRLDRTFLHFTPEEGQATHPFNPFPDLTRQKRGLGSFCNLVLDALSLNHGEGYGRGYFTARNRYFLYSILQKHEPANFDELYQLAAEEAKKDKRGYQEAFELIAVLQMLADYDQLQVLPDSNVSEADTISMANLIEHNQIAYFWLPAATESISVREIGKLALFSLLSVAIARQQQGLPTKTVYVVIDEFQRIAGENFAILLEQARSFGIALILANQTINDLNTHSKDLRPTVRTNTRVKLAFSAPEPEEIRNLSFLSGEDVVEMRSRSVSKSMEQTYGDRTETISFQERMVPRLTPQDIQRHGDHPLEFIMHVSRGGGLTQFAGLPIAVRTLRPMTLRKYQALIARRWRKEGPMVAPLPRPSQGNVDEGDALKSSQTKRARTPAEKERAAFANARRFREKIYEGVSAGGYIEMHIEQVIRNVYEELA